MALTEEQKQKLLEKANTKKQAGNPQSSGESQIYCKYCGSRIDADSIVCMYCGKRLSGNGMNASFEDNSAVGAIESKKQGFLDEINVPGLGFQIWRLVSGFLCVGLSVVGVRESAFRMRQGFNDLTVSGFSVWSNWLSGILMITMMIGGIICIVSFRSRKTAPYTVSHVFLLLALIACLLRWADSGIWIFAVIWIAVCMVITAYTKQMLIKEKGGNDSSRRVQTNGIPVASTNIGANDKTMTQALGALMVLVLLGVAVWLIRDGKLESWISSRSDKTVAITMTAETPEKVVTYFNDCLQHADAAGMNKCLSENSSSFGEDWNITSDETQVFFDWLSTMTYTIDNVTVDEDGKHAKVDVTYDFVDASGAIEDALSEVFQYSLLQNVSGQELSDEESSKLLVRHLENASTSVRTQDKMTFDCVDTDEGWRITLPLAPAVLYNVVLGNIYDTLIGMGAVASWLGQ